MSDKIPTMTSQNGEESISDDQTVEETTAGDAVEDQDQTVDGLADEFTSRLSLAGCHPRMDEGKARQLVQEVATLPTSTDFTTFWSNLLDKDGGHEAFFQLVRLHPAYSNVDASVRPDEESGMELLDAVGISTLGWRAPIPPTPAQLAGREQLSPNPQYAKKKYAQICRLTGEYYCVACGADEYTQWPPCGVELWKYSSTRASAIPIQMRLEDWRILGVPDRQAMQKRIQPLLDGTGSTTREVQWGDRYHRVVTLEIDHINGDTTDNSADNFRVLCVMCHAQTNTYKNKNRTNKDGVQPIPPLKQNR